MKALCGLCLAALALLSCGREPSSDSASVEGTAQSSAKLALESPAVGPDGAISPKVSCGAGTIWLPLKWDRVPSGTQELALYFGRLKEGAGESGSKGGVSFAAMITGISPELGGMAANTFPAGSEYQYFVSIKNCPSERGGQRFLVELFALGHPRSVPTDDDFAKRLAEEALRVEQFATRSQAASEFRAEALATGRFVAIYAPR